MAVRAHSMLLKLPSLLIMLKSVITTAVAFQRHSSCRNKLVMRGRILLEPEILVTVAWRAGLRTARSAMSCSQRCRTRRIETDSTVVNSAVRESRETRYEIAPLVALYPDESEQ